MELEKIQKEILANFDFKRVHDAMVALNWEWAQPSGLRVPELDEIKTFALLLIRQAFQERKTESGYIRLSGGGFSVAITKENHVELQFVIEDCRVA